VANMMESMRNLLILLGVLALGCHSDRSASDSGPTRAPSAAASALPARGELVVVEAVAAEFYEARMLAVEGDSARVQRVPSGDTKSVELGDVYRVTPPVKSLAVGDALICHLAGGWSACRVAAKKGDRYVVVDQAGARSELGPHQLITPTAVTELNVKRSFERAKDRAAFEAGLLRAGGPRARSGWKPAPAERVLVHREAGWFSGIVHELGKKRLTIAWPDSDRQSDVEPSAVIPMPPYATPPRRGEYALAKPSSPILPWKSVRIESLEAPDVAVRDAAGEKQKLNSADLVPLGR
jgi:hypothetical protein